MSTPPDSHLSTALTTEPSAWRHLRKRINVVLLAGFLLLIVACGGMWNWASGHTYSDGFRDGHIQKFSHRGLFWKTWEGEVGQFGFRSKVSGEGADRVATSSNTWQFSVVNNPELVAQLQALKPGAFVRMHYQERLARLPWESDTSYQLQRIEVLEDATDLVKPPK